MIMFHLLTEDENSTWTRRSRRKMLGIAIVGFVIIFSLIAIIVSQVNVSPVRQPATQVEADRSVELNLARLIKKEMNSSSNPCVNFYSYSCGVEFYSRIDVIRLETNTSVDFGFHQEGGLLYSRRINALLNESIRANESKSVSQAKRIYQACMDQDNINELALEPLHQLIRNLGGWPVLGHSNTTANISFEENLASYFINTFSSKPLYDIKVSIKPNSNYTVKIENYYPEYIPVGRKLVVRDRYKLVFRRIVANISSNGGQNTNSSINKDKIDTFVNEIRRYRQFRAKFVTKHQHRYIPRSYTGTLGNLTMKRSGFDWVKFLQIYVKYYTGHNINADTQIHIVSLQYISATNKYLRTVDPEFLQNLKVWKALIRIRKSLPTFLKADLEMFERGVLEMPSVDPEFDPYAKESQEPYCIRATNHETVVRLYSERYLSESKEWVNEIYTLLKSEFKNKLENTEWLDTGAKSKLIKRLHEMKLVMGHPEHIMNDTWLDAQGFIEDINVTRDGLLASQVKQWRHTEKMKIHMDSFTKAEYLINFEYTGTYYDLTKNIVFIGMKFLQPPVFDEKQPIAYKFGHLSYTMAHQIAHGFDFQSLLVTESHHIQLTNNSISGFKQRNHCISNQFNNYTSKSTYQHDYLRNYISGRLNEDENMCDTTGIQLAFSTYKKWKQQHELDTAYPGLETFTSDELFFLGVAQKFCPRPLLMGNVDEHTYWWNHDQRVHMMMQNTPGFGDVFQCQRGVSNLYPPENKVCRVYGKTQS